MNRALSMLVVLTPVFLMAMPLYAQVQDTVGSVDSLTFEARTGVPGGPLVMPVVVVNDVDCQGMTIPVSFPASVLSLDSVGFGGGRAAHFSLRDAQWDPGTGRLLVNLVQFSGAGMAPGRGPVAWLHFSVSAQASPGTRFVVDTGFFSEPGRLLFIGGPQGELAYLPAVHPGGVTVEAPNHSPTFLAALGTSVREGDSVSLSVVAGDIDGDPIRLALLNRPPGAQFVDLGAGEGVFRWRVPFTGPFSASASPVILRLTADDGEDATQVELPLNIINVNRPPVLTVPDTVWGVAFDSLDWQASAVDPDLDPVVISVTGVPEPADVATGNPVHIRWRPVQADTGSYPVAVRAQDGHGGVDERLSVLRVVPGDRVILTLDTVSGFVDEQITLSIHMCNQEALAGLELLFSLDPTAVTVLGVDRAGSRIENWEMVAVTQDYAGRPGDIQVIARADINDGIPTPNLAPGDGTIIRVHLKLISDEAFAGLSFPVRFVFRTPLANTATDAQGQTILQNEIAYVHGEVSILAFEDRLLGDINLNGLAFEVGDVVYFANYFSNPVAFPLSFEQRANSDVNGDGTPATIADLVYMINVITSGGLRRVAPLPAVTARWSIDESGALVLDGVRALGGLFLELRSRDGIELGPAAEGMTITEGQTLTTRRLLMYSWDGHTIDPARGAVLQGLHADDVISMSAADPRGYLVDLTAGSATVPRAVALGNFPNPFNPSTAIRFTLPAAGHVDIEIFNVLGRHVGTLQGDFAAGSHELLWDGRDGSGQTVASGVYYYRLVHGETRQVRRMTLLK